MQDVIRQITGMRRRAWVLLVALRVSVVIALLVVGGLVLALADYVFRFPGAARLVLDAAVVAIMAVAFWRWILPAVIFWPTLTDVALRAERLLPNLSGHLASGIEFSTSGEGTHSRLAKEAVAEAQRRVLRENLGTVLDARRTLAGTGGLIAAVALLSVLIGLVPGHASIAARRWFDPLGSAKWPARTGVLSAMGGGVHARGVALPLRARIGRGFSEGMRVYAHYRIEDDGRNGRWEQVMLTHQNDHLFERLVDADGDAVEYWFESADDRTDVERMLIVEPPQIAEARLEITPPDYARDILGVSSIELGPGTDERSILGAPALAGSGARLTLSLNKAIGTRASADSAQAWQTMLGMQVADGAEVVDFTATAELDDEWMSNRWTLSWTLTETTRLAPVLVDQYGLTGPDDVFYRLDVRPDSAPTVTILEPMVDQTSLPTGYIAIASEARDDVRVESCAIEVAVNLDPRVADEDHDPGVWRTIATTLGEDVVATVWADLDLASLGVEVGDVVTIRSSATDVFALEGQSHEPAYSSPRLVQIISEAQFVEQLYQKLSSVRESAIRIDEQQQELNARVESSAVRLGDVRDQGRTSQQIARQRDALDQAAGQLQSNRLDDRAIESLINEARGLVEQAGRASDNASESLAQAGMADAPDADPEQARQNALEAQDEVSERLADVISLLDEGRDSWVMRREIERLRQEQADLQQRSNEVTNQTRGKSADQLTAAERAALESLSAQQRDLARQAGELTQQLLERADQVEEMDSDLADAMRQAATQAQQEALEEQMSSAAQQLEENQGQLASGSQQEAMETLSEMLSGLESVDRAKVQRLKRELASLVQSIESLIAQQENELNAFFASGGVLVDLIDGMHQLNVNTYSVQEMAREAGREVMAVTGHLETAGVAQSGVIDAMRESVAEPEVVQSGEQRSLEALRSALAEARKLQEQLNNDEMQQQREELIKAYRGLYERELALRGEINTLGQNGPLNRRDRIRAQQLGREQTAIRTGAAQMLIDFEGLSDSLIFNGSHEQIDRLTELVSDALLGGDVGGIVQMRAGDVADRFAALAMALEESQSQDEFVRPGGGGGGSGSGSGSGSGGPEPLVPPAAQLKLLRSLQEAVYRSTRSLDDSGTLLDNSSRTQRLGEIGDSQSQIADLAEQLIEELRSNAGGGGGGSGPLPGERGGQEP